MRNISLQLDYLGIFVKELTGFLDEKWIFDSYLRNFF